MAELATNLWLQRKLYRPGDTPPAELWDQVPEAAWETTPEIVTPNEQSPTGNGGGEAKVEPLTGSPGVAQAGVGGDAPAAPDDLSGLLGDSLQAPETPADGDDPPAPSLLEQLSNLPDDKGVLLGFAQANSIDVDLRKGPEKLRAQIAEALA